MNRQRLELALEKQRLLLQSGELRQRLASVGDAWRPALGLADRLREGVDWLRRHPPIVIAALAGLLVARPRAIFSLAGRAWLLLGTLRRLREGAQAAVDLADTGRRRDG